MKKKKSIKDVHSPQMNTFFKNLPSHGDRTHLLPLLKKCFPLLKVNFNPIAALSNEVIAVDAHVMFMIAEKIQHHCDPDALPEILTEVLNGAYVQIKDMDGAFYDSLIVMLADKGLRKRRSSHHSDAPQYAIAGKAIKEFLFSTKVVDGKKYLWFQLESRPAEHRISLRALLNLILHLIDWVKYKLTGENIGPYGKSVHTEINPIIIDEKPGCRNFKDLFPF